MKTFSFVDNESFVLPKPKYEKKEDVQSFQIIDENNCVIFEFELKDKELFTTNKIYKITVKDSEGNLVIHYGCKIVKIK